MNPQEHKKVLAIFFLGEFALGALGFLFMAAYFVFFVFLNLLKADVEDFGNIGISIGTSLLLILIPLLVITPLGLAGWKMLKDKENARFWGIIASVFSFPFMCPFGIFIGIYGLWFMFSRQGKDHFSGRFQNKNQQTFTPPQNWR